MDLLAAFGIDKEDFTEEKKVPKKPKKESKKKSKCANYKLPILFCGGHLRQIFTDEQETEWSEEKLKSNLQEVFRELKGIYFKLSILEVEQKEDINTYVKPEITRMEFTNEDKLEFPLEVIAGDAVLQVESKVALEEIRNMWVEQHSEYAGCKFQYDEKQKLLLPFMESNAPKGKQYSTPITVGYLGIKEKYKETDFNTAEIMEKDIQSKLVEKYPEFTGCGFAYHEDLELLFPIMQNSTSTEKKIELVALPVEIRAGGFKLLVQSDDVSGKKQASLEELRKVLEEVYPEYSEERTEMLYDTKHFVVPVLKSSKKGVTILSEDSEWTYEVCLNENGVKWRVENTPFGIFKCNISEKNESLFILKAPKISWHLIEEVVRIFRRNPLYEYAVQIFYDRNSQQYELYEPEQEVAKSRVTFKRNMEQEREKILVMDIHSHGSYSAFFSQIDDEDEKGVRLYMVFGNLDQKEYSYALRVGVAGIFGQVALEDIFEKREDESYEI